MGRKAEISEPDVVAFIKECLDSGKRPNSGHIRAHFGVGCTQRYENILNAFLVQREQDDKRAKQLVEVELPSNIREMLVVATEKLADDYSQGFISVFNEAVEIGRHTLAEVTSMFEDQVSILEEEKADLHSAIAQSDKIVIELEEMLESSKTNIERLELENQVLVEQNNRSQETISRLAESIKTGEDMKMSLDAVIAEFKQLSG